MAYERDSSCSETLPALPGEENRVCILLGSELVETMATWRWTVCCHTSLVPGTWWGGRGLATPRLLQLLWDATSYNQSDLGQAEPQLHRQRQLKCSGPQVGAHPWCTPPPLIRIRCSVRWDLDLQHGLTVKYKASICFPVFQMINFHVRNESCPLFLRMV